MTDRQLANAVLMRLIRPRTGEIRRLADAVIASAGKKQSKKKDGKGRKLAKIPGQAGKKKKKV